MANRLRQPATLRGATIGAPPGSPTGPSDSETPAFCFKFCQNGFKIENLSDEYKVALADKLHKLSERSWTTIKTEDRKKNGTEIIVRTSLRKSIPGDITEDVKILAFHLPNLFRMLGWRNHRIFHVIWLDPNGELYQH